MSCSELPSRPCSTNTPIQPPEPIEAADIVNELSNETWYSAETGTQPACFQDLTRYPAEAGIGHDPIQWTVSLS